MTAAATKTQPLPGELFRSRTRLEIIDLESDFRLRWNSLNDSTEGDPLLELGCDARREDLSARVAINLVTAAVVDLVFLVDGAAEIASRQR